MVTGMKSTDIPGVWTCILGDGYSAAPDSWSSLDELTIARPGSNIEFKFPSASFPDVFRMFFLEAYSGSEAYTRPCFSHSLPGADFITNLWREPVPFNLGSNYGLALDYSRSYVWLTRPDGVWRAPLTNPSLDVSGDVLAAVTETETFRGHLTLALRNDDGRYNTLGSGKNEPIKKGAMVRVSWGYQTSKGKEAVSGPAYWITGWSYSLGGGRSVFTIFAQDAWSLLERWHARRQYTWAKGDTNIFNLLAFICSRAGCEFSSYSYSSAMVNQYPAFTIYPGERGISAVQRLLRMVPDVMFPIGTKFYIRNSQSSDATTYSYGVDHLIKGGYYVTAPKGVNRVQVYGEELLTEDWDWTELEQVYDFLGQVLDLNLETTTKAHQRGEAVLRNAGIRSTGGSILVLVNCGQDIYDVIDITSSALNMTAEKRRVLSLAHRYLPMEGEYSLRLGLGAV